MFTLMSSIFTKFYVLWSFGSNYKTFAYPKVTNIFFILPRIVVVLAFTFRSVIHFRFIFVYEVRHGLRLLIIICGHSVVLPTFILKALFSPIILLDPF